MLARTFPCEDVAPGFQPDREVCAGPHTPAEVRAGVGRLDGLAEGAGRRVLAELVGGGGDGDLLRGGGDREEQGEKDETTKTWEETEIRDQRS